MRDTMKRDIDSLKTVKTDRNPTDTGDPTRMMHAMYRASCESMPPEQYERWLDAVYRHFVSGVTLDQHLAALTGDGARVDNSHPDIVREDLAAYAHEAWSGWMRYMFSKCFSNDAGELTIPAWAVARWTRQMSTAYWDLPLGEPDSDRAEADKIMAIVCRRA